jgi:hypothetical protein
MRVLFTTWASTGHYLPMVPTAWALRAAGHDVRMTSQPALAPVLRDSGLPSTVVGRDVDLMGLLRTARGLVERRRPGGRTGRLSDCLAGRTGRANLVHGYRILREIEDDTAAMYQALWTKRPVVRNWRLSFYGEQAEAMIEGLLDLARSWRPDLIVYDPFTHAGPVVAKLIGVPAVRHLFGPDIAYFTDTTGETRGWAAMLSRYGFGADEVDLRGSATVDPCPPSLQIDDTAAPVRRIRTRYVPYNGVAEVPGWLAEPPARPRICLTWGTSVHQHLGDDAFLPGETMLGCAKLADERDAELVLAIAANQRAMLPPDLPSGVRVVESVPLDALLPTCTAIVHQGGAGTMLTGLRHGLPQLVLTQSLDQATNAFQLVAAGAGQTLAAEGMLSSDLMAAGHELLDDPAYRAAARRIQHEIRSAPTPAEVVRDLVALT